MPGDPVRAKEFSEESGERGQALAEFLVWVGHQQSLSVERASRANLQHVRFDAKLIGAMTVKAAGVVNYWLDRNNLRAATFWLQMVMNNVPAEFAERVQQMDRYQVDAEIEAWGQKLGFTKEEAQALAEQLIEAGGGESDEARDESKDFRTSLS